MSYSCFVISPIGEPGTAVRNKADDVFDLLIKPAMEIFDFTIFRADHKYSTTDIVEAMVNDIQQADLCIVNLTDLNPNVMYELGRRHETGKPFILIIEKNQFGSVPFDTSALKTITYDFSSVRLARESAQEIQSVVRYMIEGGFASNAKATLASIAETLNRIERKFDFKQIPLGDANPPITEAPAGSKNIQELFSYAVKQNNIKLLESLLPRLENAYDFIDFHDEFVSASAARGSRLAGKLMKENMDNFLMQADSFKMKYEYASCYVSYCVKRNLELTEQSFVEDVMRRLMSDAVQDTEKADLFNMINRLYYRAYLTTKDFAFLEKAIACLNDAISLDTERPTFYFNLALCHLKADNFAEAENAIAKCLTLSGDDSDYLKLACQIFKVTSNPALAEIAEMLKRIDPIKYSLLFE